MLAFPLLYTKFSLKSTNCTICLRAWEMTGVSGVPGVAAPGVEAAGVVAPGVPPGVVPGVVPGVAGMITTGTGPGLSAPPAASSRGVDVTKRASLIR